MSSKVSLLLPYRRSAQSITSVQLLYWSFLPNVFCRSKGWQDLSPIFLSARIVVKLSRLGTAEPSKHVHKSKTLLDFKCTVVLVLLVTAVAASVLESECVDLQDWHFSILCFRTSRSKWWVFTYAAWLSRYGWSIAILWSCLSLSGWVACRMNGIHIVRLLDRMDPYTACTEQRTSHSFAEASSSRSRISQSPLLK